MAYNMIANGLSPEAFGAGGNDGFGGFMQRWGNGWRNSMNSGMDFGNKFYAYGTNNRLAPFAERNAYQKMDTELASSQNDFLRNVGDQSAAACHAVNWATPQCQQLRMAINGQQTLTGAPSSASSMLGTSRALDSDTSYNTTADGYYPGSI